MIPEISEHRAEIEESCRRYRVARLDLFGSAVGTGFRRDDSDLDFLVQFESPDAPGHANRYFGLLEALRDLVGRPVDLVVESAITNPYFRESVERTRTSLYKASARATTAVASAPGASVPEGPSAREHA